MRLVHCLALLPSLLLVQAAAVTDSPAGLPARNHASLAPTDRTFDVARFGAKCDGVTDDTVPIQQAFAAAAVAGGPSVLRIDRGSCLISAPIVQAIAPGHGILLRGPGGDGGIRSANGAGIAITLTADGAGFDAEDVAFHRFGAAGAIGTGLSVQALAGQTMIKSHFEHLTFSGPSLSTSWQIGLHLIGTGAAVVHGLRVAQPNATLDPLGGTGLLLTGTDTSHFSIDTKISDSIFQGGHVGIKGEGAIQGIFVTNSEIIGSDYGIYDADPGGNKYCEAVIATNNHFNNKIGAIYLNSCNQSQIVNNLFLHFNVQPSDQYKAIWAHNSGWIVASMNGLNGAKIGSEAFFVGDGGQHYTVTGNNVVNISGLAVDLSDHTNAAMVSGNVFQTVAPPGIRLDPSAQYESQAGNAGSGTIGGMIPEAGFSPDIGSETNPWHAVWGHQIVVVPPQPGINPILSASPAGVLTIDAAGLALTGGTITVPDGTTLCWNRLCAGVEASTGTLVVKATSGDRLFSIDALGNVLAKGSIKGNASP